MEAEQAKGLEIDEMLGKADENSEKLVKKKKKRTFKTVEGEDSAFVGI